MNDNDHHICMSYAHVYTYIIHKAVLSRNWCLYIKLIKISSTLQQSRRRTYPCKVSTGPHAYNTKAVEKYLQVQRTRYLWALRSFQMFTGHLIQTKLHLHPRELCNPQSKAAPGQFHGSGVHSKRNCLQDQDNFHGSSGHSKHNCMFTRPTHFHRYRARQIVIILLNCKGYL